MKVVINACFGGFGLSRLATGRLAELRGRPCYFFTNEREPGQPDLNKYEPLALGDPAPLMWYAFDVPEPNAEEYDDVLWRDHYLGDRDIERHDPLLVQVVEELGDAANGSCAKLKIVEIPDETDYVIEEYYGNEHVAEQHRTWS